MITVPNSEPGKNRALLAWKLARLSLRAPSVIKAVRGRNLSYLEGSALFDLHKVVRALDHDGVPGRIVEAGTALGGSAIVMGSAKARGRQLDLHDVFGTIPPPSVEDDPDVHARYAEIIDGKATGIGGEKYYGYENDLLKKVKESFRDFGLDPVACNIHFHQGLFEDTIRSDGPVALAHIDGDWYESVRVCLDRLAPSLSVGGVMVIDDYGSWSGCTKAVDEFLAAPPVPVECSWARRLHIRRVG